MREVKNDRLSLDQLIEPIRNMVRKEIRRVASVLSPTLGNAAATDRTTFCLPFYAGITSNQNANPGANTNILFALVAGSKPLSVRKLNLLIEEFSTAASLNTSTMDYYWARFTGKPLLNALPSAGQPGQIFPVGLARRDAQSSYAGAFCENAAITLISDTISLQRQMGILQVSTHANAAVARRMAPIELGDGVQDLLVIPPGSGLALVCSRATTSGGAIFVNGFIQWEE